MTQTRHQLLIDIGMLEGPAYDLAKKVKLPQQEKIQHVEFAKAEDTKKMSDIIKERGKADELISLFNEAIRRHVKEDRHHHADHIHPLTRIQHQHVDL